MSGSLGSCGAGFDRRCPVAGGTRRSEHRDRRAARRPSWRRACDRREDHRLSAGARPVHVRRPARRDLGDRALADRRPEGPRPAVSWLRAPAYLLAGALCVGLALANVTRIHTVGIARISCRGRGGRVRRNSPDAPDHRCRPALPARLVVVEHAPRRARPEPDARAGWERRPRSGRRDRAAYARAVQSACPGTHPAVQRSAPQRACRARAATRPLAAAGRHHRRACRREAAARAGRMDSTSGRGYAATGCTSSCESTSGALSVIAAVLGGVADRSPRAGSRRRSPPAWRESGARSSRGSCSATTTRLSGQPEAELPRLGPLPPARGLGRERRSRRRLRARCSRGWSASHVGSESSVRSPRSAAYVLAVGPQPSVIRAAVSGSLASLAWLDGPAARCLVRASASPPSCCSGGTRTSSSTPASSSRSPRWSRSSPLAPRIARRSRGLPGAAEAASWRSRSRLPAVS